MLLGYFSILGVVILGLMLGYQTNLNYLLAVILFICMFVHWPENGINFLFFLGLYGYCIGGCVKRTFMSK